MGAKLSEGSSPPESFNEEGVLLTGCRIYRLRQTTNPEEQSTEESTSPKRLLDNNVFVYINEDETIGEIHPVVTGTSCEVSGDVLECLEEIAQYVSIASVKIVEQLKCVPFVEIKTFFTFFFTEARPLDEDELEEVDSEVKERIAKLARKLAEN